MIFGNFPVPVNEFLAQLASAIPEEATTAEPKEWTRAVKKVLCEKTFDGYEPYACTEWKHKKLHEFLLDAIWYEKSPGMGILLAVESEWGVDSRSGPREGQILDDFEKLMVIKSPVKLMIYESENRNQNALIMQKITEYLVRFSQHVEGENYCLLNFSHGTHEAYRFVVPADGKLTSVKFEQVKEATGPDKSKAA